jgi:phosphoglycerate kinase
MKLERLKSTAGVDLKDKRVLVRADLNVPLKDGKVADATRLERLLPGLRDLAKRGARVGIISHFGRPRHGRDPQLSLAPVADKLGELLGKPVTFAEDCVGEPAERTLAALLAGQIAVLENLRFHKGEEKNEPAFAKRLAALGDVYINDAFPRRTARTPPPQRSPICCPPTPGRCCWRRSRRSSRAGKSRCGRPRP